MQYKKAQRGTKVNGEPITKEAVKMKMVKLMGDKFPNVSIPDSTMNSYAVAYLSSGLREEALDQLFKRESERQSKGLPKLKLKL